MPDPPSTAEGWLYWIVQPLQTGHVWQRGFRSFFQVLSLTRTEYENPRAALKSLYEAAGGAPVSEAHEITAPPTSRPVYFVGPEIAPLPQGVNAFGTLSAKARAMEVWLRSGGESKMPCWFAESFHGSTPVREVFRDGVAQFAELPEWERPIAWWAMPQRGEQGFMFTLDPTVAEKLLEAIETTQGSLD